MVLHRRQESDTIEPERTTKVFDTHTADTQPAKEHIASPTRATVQPPNRHPAKAVLPESSSTDEDAGAPTTRRSPLPTDNGKSTQQPSAGAIVRPSTSPSRSSSIATSQRTIGRSSRPSSTTGISAKRGSTTSSAPTPTPSEVSNIHNFLYPTPIPQPRPAPGAGLSTERITAHKISTSLAIGIVCLVLVITMILVAVGRWFYSRYRKKRRSEIQRSKPPTTGLPGEQEYVAYPLAAVPGLGAAQTRYDPKTRDFQTVVPPRHSPQEGAGQFLGHRDTIERQYEPLKRSVDNAPRENQKYHHSLAPARDHRPPSITSAPVEQLNGAHNRHGPMPSRAQNTTSNP